GSDNSSDNWQPPDELSEETSEETSEENLNGINASDNSDNSDNTFPAQSGSLDDESVCQRCGIPVNATCGQLIRAGRDGAAGHYHPRCWTEERTKGPWQRRSSADRRPALGPEGDSLDDLRQ